MVAVVWAYGEPDYRDINLKWSKLSKDCIYFIKEEYWNSIRQIVELYDNNNQIICPFINRKKFELLAIVRQNQIDSVFNNETNR
jgi:hypothetical protein